MLNHVRAYRPIREDNLLCLRRRKFVVTTEPACILPVHPNLEVGRTRRRQDQGEGQRQLIWLLVEFGGLPLCMAGYSQRVIGRVLDSSLQDALTMQGLRMGLDQLRLRKRDGNSLRSQHSICFGFTNDFAPIRIAQVK